MSQGVRVVLVTAPADEAMSLARKLVEARLAACANVIPAAKSVYRWEGRVVEDDESLMIIKTGEGSVDGLRRMVADQHSYDVPEFLVLSVEDGLPEYLSWVMTEIGGEA